MDHERSGRRGLRVCCAYCGICRAGSVSGRFVEMGAKLDRPTRIVMKIKAQKFPIEVVVSLTNGVLLCKFDKMHELAEHVLGHRRGRLRDAIFDSFGRDGLLASNRNATL